MNKIIKRMNEIRSRQAEIRALLEGDGEVNMEDITKELRELETEYLGLEQRKSALDGMNAGGGTPSPIENPLVGGEQRGAAQLTRDNVLESPVYRSAWAKTLMCRSLTADEQRAVDVALTTTATEFVAGGADADGVNNGGLFIPTSVNMALMEAIGLTSPLFRDAAKTAVPGIIKFPYKKDGSGAENQTEGKANKDGSMEWAELVLGVSEISETIRVTWKLEAMSVDGFIDYIIQELTEQVKDTAVTALIYGSGNNEMSGIKKDSIESTYDGDVLTAFSAALKVLPKKKKIGAKLYVSNAIVETISFMKDNEGRFVYTPINSEGVKTIATYPVEVDPYLNDDDFVIGAMGRYYRMNTNEPLSITKDVSGKNRINDYTGYMLLSGAAQPNSLVFGTKKA